MNLRELFTKQRPQPAERPRAEKPAAKRTWRGGHIPAKVLIGLAVALMLWRLFPALGGYEFSDLREGTVSKRQINAPFDFWVHKNERELALERQKARQSTPPVLRLDPNVATVALDSLGAFLDATARIAREPETRSVRLDTLMAQNPWLSEDVGAYLIVLFEKRDASSTSDGATLQKTSADLLRNVYTDGRGLLEDRSALAKEVNAYGSLVDGTAERQTLLAAVRDLPEVKKALIDQIRQRLEGDKLVKSCYVVTTAFLKPNVRFDVEETERRREAAAARVPVNKTMFLADQKIIGANEIVNSEHVDILNSLAMEQARQNVWQRHTMQMGRLLIVCALMAFFAAYLRIFRPSVFGRNGFLALLGILIVLPIVIATAIASYAGAYTGYAAFLIPVAMSAMLVTILFDGEMGLVVTLVIAFLWGVMRGYDFQSTLVSVLCGGVGVHLVRKVRHRHQFYQPMVYIPVAYAVAIAITNLLHFTSLQEMARQIPVGIVNGFFSTVLVIGFLPIFESLFNVPTDITLLELSDFNRPLLRDVALATPGSYQHSIIVGNLAGAAAEAIGANSLLARVGSYYHDIGKMDKGEYFSENQIGMENPHDKLTPNLSRVVLASHVKDGVELAERHGLPKALRDIIQQHHGTSVMASFYHRAVQQAGDREDVQEKDFRYAGPRPRTKEAGIILLADAVESAARSLTDPTPGQLKGLIRNVVQGKLSDLQLDECDLTMGDLSKIEEAFLPVLVGVLHGRIKYPWQSERETAKAGAT